MPDLEYYEGESGAEHKVRAEYPNGTKEFFEGEKDAERLVRTEFPSGLKQFYEGEQGAERLLRVEDSDGRKCFFEGEKGAERQVRFEFPDGEKQFYKGEDSDEREEEEEEDDDDDKIDDKIVERNVFVHEYNAEKRAIRAHLCFAGDAPTALVQPGSFPYDIAPRMVKHRMEQLRGDGKECKLMRGYKLTSLLPPNSGIESLAYNAKGIVVIQHVDGKYESLAQNSMSSDRSPFIFVPSSRMHTELSDEQLLSGHFMLATVIDGPKSIIDTLMRLRVKMSRFEQRKICRSPEEAHAVKSVLIRYFPHFDNWIKNKCQLPKHLYVDIAIAFGMATRPTTDVENDYILSGGHTEAPVPTRYEDRRSLTKETGDWTFESDMWLDGVKALHMLVDGTATQKAGDSAARLLYIRCYDSLEIEYAKRLAGYELKARAEHAAQYHEFR